MNGKLKYFTHEWQTAAFLHSKNEFTENKLLRRIIERHRCVTFEISYLNDEISYIILDVRVYHANDSSFLFQGNYECL